uniref:Aspartate racemase n=1 Tax=Araucaria cunninghamii TaxID=56994 RepID=A0A0D6QVC0_ARACU
MTLQYSTTIAVHCPSSVCNNGEQQHFGRSIHRRRQQQRLLRKKCGILPKYGYCPLVAYAIKPSLLPETDESEKSLDFSGCSARMVAGSKRVFRQPNTVGILGGASVRSTADFVNKLVEWSWTEAEESLPLLLCSDPQLKKELSQSSALVGIELQKRKSPDRANPAVAALREKIAFLESSGACCIVMPCHVSHVWYEELSQVCSVPFLHMGECVAQELKDANLKPIETGSNVKIGLLGTEATMRAGFYQEKLSNQGFEVVLPDKATMEHVVLPSLEAMHMKDIEGARILLRIALQVLLVRAVSVVVLASYDMRSLLTPDDPLLKKCLDPIDTLARATVKWSHSARTIT